MAVETYLKRTFSELLTPERCTDEMREKMRLFDYSTLRNIKHMDDNMLGIAAKIMSAFATNETTKEAFLSNHRNSLYFSMECILSCKSPLVIADMLDLLVIIYEGLLQQQNPTMIFVDRSLEFIVELILSDYKLTVKVKACEVLHPLLKLIITKGIDLQNVALVKQAIHECLMAFTWEDNLIYKLLCQITTIYLKGVDMNIFEYFELVHQWIEMECISYIHKDMNESTATDVLRCIRTLCDLMNANFPNDLQNVLLVKLDTLIHLASNTFLKNDSIVIIAQVVSSKLNQLNMPFEPDTSLKNDLKAVVCSWGSCTNDLMFVILFLEYNFCQLSINKNIIKRLITAKLNDTENPSVAVLKSVALLFPFVSEATDSNHDLYSQTIFEAMMKTDQLEVVVSYHNDQLHWILKKAMKPLRKRVLKLWIRNNNVGLQVIVQAIKKCGGCLMLLEYLTTDVKERTGQIIKALNDPKLRQRMCEMIPGAALELLPTLLESGASIPTTEQSGYDYIDFLLHLIINTNAKLQRLGLIIKYIIAILRSFNTSKAIAEMVCDTVMLEHLLKDIVQANTETVINIVELLFFVLKMEHQHNIAADKLLEIDVGKMLINGKSESRYTERYGIVMELIRQLMKTRESRILCLPARNADVQLINAILDEPEGVDKNVTLRVVTKLMKRFPEYALVPTISCHISSMCRVIDAADSHLMAFIVYLQLFLKIRKTTPWTIYETTKRSLLAFAHRFKRCDEVDVAFISRHFEEGEDSTRTGFV